VLRLHRRPVRTHGDLVKDELGESFDHLVQAANHAADGVGATVGPRYDAARERVAPAANKVKGAATTGYGTTIAVLTPLAVSAKHGAMRITGRKPEPPPKRWPRITMLVAAGVAVGALAALVLRQTRQQRWEEYDPSRPLDEAADTAQAAVQRAADSASTSAEEMAGKASSAIDSARSRVASAEFPSNNSRA
jgi:hypothetical protein